MAVLALCALQSGCNRILGIEKLSPAPAVDAGTSSTDGGSSWSTTTAVSAGTAIRLRLTTTNVFSADHLAKLSLGGLVVDWLVHTRAPGAGDVLNLGPTANVAVGSAQTSDPGQLPAFPGSVKVTSITVTPTSAANAQLLYGTTPTLAVLNSTNLGSGETVTYSPAVPAGATGGGTWSKKPSFSSYMWKSTVFDHTSGLATSAPSTWLVSHSPRAGGDDGCSS